MATNKRVINDEELKAAKLSVEVDTVADVIETICLPNYMSKSEAAAFLLIDHNREPAFTEAVWEELERQNPVFFRAYKIRLMLIRQIRKFNLLVASQKEAISVASQNGVASTPLPNGNSPCSTSNGLSNPNNQQRDIVPPTSDMRRIHSENQSDAHAANGGNASAQMHQEMSNGHFVQNGFVHPPITDTSSRMHRGMMNGSFVQNGFVRDPVNDTSTRIQHQGLYGPILPNGVDCAPAMMDASDHMHHGSNDAFGPNDSVCGPGINMPTQMQGLVCDSGNATFDATMPHYDPFIHIGTYFPMSNTIQDMMERLGAPLSVPSNFFVEDIDSSQIPEIPALPENDLPDDCHVQGEALRRSYYPSSLNPAQCNFLDPR